MNISQFDSSFSSQSSLSSRNGSLSFSQSPFVDIAKCNQHRFWKSMTRGLKRYLTCFKPMKSVKRDTKGEISSNLSNVSPKGNRSYYGEMNHKEREEKLQSAIRYCKGSTLEVKLGEKQSSESETTPRIMIM